MGGWKGPVFVPFICRFWFPRSPGNTIDLRNEECGDSRSVYAFGIDENTDRTGQAQHLIPKAL